VFHVLRGQADEKLGPVAPGYSGTRSFVNEIIGNNRTALEAAADCARQRGYTVHTLGSDNAGVADAVGVDLAERCLAIRDRHTPSGPPACLISGGEPVVHFNPTDQPRKGGRNQQLVLAATERLWKDGLSRLAILSGGTDGEDGPTDAAGACIDAELLANAHRLGLSPGEYRERQNAYPFFEQAEGLLKTGPTHTNVMDLRICVIGETAAGRQTESGEASGGRRTANSAHFRGNS
jgi:glycerate-2-kinase